MIFHPTLDEARALASQGNLCPLYCEVPADLETPVSAYLKVARGRYSFLLESVEGGERLARYSFIGTEPYRTLRSGDGVSGDGSAGDPLIAVEAGAGALQARDGAGPAALHRRRRRLPGLRGRALLRAARAHGARTTRSACPKRLHVHGHAARLRPPAAQDQGRQPLPPRRRHRGGVPAGGLADRGAGRRASRSRWTSCPTVPAPASADDAGRHLQHDARGASQRPCSRRRSTSSPATSSRSCCRSASSGRPRRTPSTSTAPCARSTRRPTCTTSTSARLQLVGTSPEMLVRVEDGKIDYHPIAGTRPPRRRRRPRTTRSKRSCVNDEKERAEHVMLLDLGRNDVGRVSEPGTVEVPQIMDVERYSHVMHLVSHVTGRLREGLTLVRRAARLLPGRHRLRRAQDPGDGDHRRAGARRSAAPTPAAVGYFDLSGNLDTAITIRTILMKDGVAHVQSGGGIVYDSDPADRVRRDARTRRRP